MAVGQDALIIASNPAEIAALERRLGPRFGRNLRSAQGHVEGRRALDHRPAFLFLHSIVPGAVQLSIAAARLVPAPIQIALGSSSTSARLAFELGQAGVRAFLTFPCSDDELFATIDEAIAFEPELSSFVPSLVGLRPLREVQQEVRRQMFCEAYGRTGTRRGTARLLGVTRQAAQQALASTGLIEPVETAEDRAAS